MFYLDASIQLTKNLLGMADDARILKSEGFDEFESMKKSIATNNAAGISFILLPKLFLSIFIDDYEGAVLVARKIQRSNCDNLTAFDMQYIAFLTALSEMIVARQTKRKRFLKAGNKALKRLEEMTRRCSDKSWLNRIFLVKAERDAFEGSIDESIRKFNHSIALSKEFGFVHEQALAYERLGVLYSDLQYSEKPAECLRKARDLYEEWGCAIKVSRMNYLLSGRA